MTQGRLFYRQEAGRGYSEGSVPGKAPYGPTGYITTHSSTQQRFIAGLLNARHCSRPLGYSMSKTKTPALGVLTF